MELYNKIITSGGTNTGKGWCFNSDGSIDNTEGIGAFADIAWDCTQCHPTYRQASRQSDMIDRIAKPSLDVDVSTMRYVSSMKPLLCGCLCRPEDTNVYGQKTTPETIVQLSSSSQNTIQDRNHLNLDIGGGQYDDTSLWLLNTYNVVNHIYDPYNRSVDHNMKVLADDFINKYDSVTIMSVLNVVSSQSSRIELLKLANKYLKPNGLLYIKVWKGDNSGVPVHQPEKQSFQANQPCFYFLEEVKSIFPSAVCVTERNFICAINI